MKKSILLLGVIASVLMLASCASKDNSMNQGAAPAPVAASAHHDYKGEVGK